MAPGNGREGARWRLAGSRWAAAILIAVSFCFTGLSNHALRASDETRVAGIGWEMQAGGNGPIPYLGGEPFLEHPPLYYALLGGFIRMLGAHESVARLPGAIASFLTLLLVFDLGRRIASARVGLLAVLVLVSIRSFYRYSHTVLVDPLLMLFVLLGFYGYLWAVWDLRRPRAGDGAAAMRELRPRASALGIFGIYVAAGLAFYVKGPVGIVALGGPVAVDVLAFRRWSVLKSVGHVAGIPLLLAVCASWPALLYLHEGAPALREFAIQNGLYRILPGAGAGEYQGGHVKPVWYYLGTLPAHFTWWLAFLPALALWIQRGVVPAGWSRDAIRFLALVFPVGALLLSIPGTKRGLYLLPFVPPIALAIAAWLGGLALPDATRSRLERVSARLAPQRLIWVAFAGSIAWNVVGYPHVSHHRDLGPMSREIASAFDGSQIVGYQLPEELRGALPFYTGRIAVNLRSQAALASFLSDGHLLLAEGRTQRNLDAQVRERLRAVASWRGAERDYAIYEVEQSSPPPAASELRTGESAPLSDGSTQYTESDGPQEPESWN